MKHNNAIPKNHNRKTNRPIKTWFDQPAKAMKRRKLRDRNARICNPMPVKKLRPIVRCSSIRYNKKLREGRGFSQMELEKAGLSHHYARTIGIAVDLRRKNTNQESVDMNAERLKEYVSKLTFYSSVKEAKEAGAVQYKGKIMPIVKQPVVVNAISKEELESL